MLETFCANPISGKILILEIYARKLSTNQIARFFKLLYIFWTVQPFFIFFCIKIEYDKTFKMMLSLLWKNAYLPPKRAKRRKSGQSSWAKSIFFVFTQSWLKRFFWFFAWSPGSITAQKWWSPIFLKKFSFDPNCAKRVQNSPK